VSEALKNDNGKDRWDLLPMVATLEVVKVLTVGAKKYEDWNWLKGKKYSAYYAASQRHLTAWWGGEELDPETDKHHLAHAICCLLFLLTYCLIGKFRKFDDRIKK
jgi:hypothetical protein